MNDKLLHTPEGVRDVYNGECLRKTSLEQRLIRLFQSYGYHPIQTPTFEFFDIFSSEVGTTPSRELYKFFDREGNTLVLRPDFTPSIARAVSKYFGDKKILRLCYNGNVFINNSSYQGRLKESTQLGAELIGEDSVESDGEIIAMVVNSLKASGLTKFQISIGHADIFAGLMEATDFSLEEQDTLKHLIMNKSFYSVHAFLAKRKVPEDLLVLFDSLSQMLEGPDQWEGYRNAAKNYPKIYGALTYLKDLHEVLKIYDVDGYVSYEFGLLTTHKYYTGIIFSGYTFGSGEPIVKGGRYNRLMQYFKKDAPAIGFAVELDPLLYALARQGLAENIQFVEEKILYTKEKRGEAIAYATGLRCGGENAELILVEDEKEMQCIQKSYENDRVKIFC